MDLDKEVFTTFEAADICNANITSIKNWIEQGELEAFRTPGGHYRIPREVLDDFLSRHGMPNPFAEKQATRVLVIDADGEEWLDEVEETVGTEHEYESAVEAVDAVLKIGHWKPDVAVVNVEMEELDVGGLCQTVREYDDLCQMTVIVIGDEEYEAQLEPLRKTGADITHTGTCGPEAVSRMLRDVL